MRRSRDALVFLDFTQKKRGVSANRYLRLVLPFSLRLLLGEDGWRTERDATTSQGRKRDEMHGEDQETPPPKQF